MPHCLLILRQEAPYFSARYNCSTELTYACNKNVALKCRFSISHVTIHTQCHSEGIARRILLKILRFAQDDTLKILRYAQDDTLKILRYAQDDTPCEQ